MFSNQRFAVLKTYMHILQADFLNIKDGNSLLILHDFVPILFTLKNQVARIPVFVLYRAADLRLCFRICKKEVFSWHGLHLKDIIRLT